MANVKGGRYVESLYYPIVNPITGQEHYPSSNGNWRFNKDKMNKLIENNEIYFGEDGKGRPKLKRFLSEVKSGITWTSLWDFVPLNTSGSSEMASILGNLSIFDNPKPVGLIQELLKLGSKNNSIILDFFSGSATTAHTVMQLNAEDSGKRRYILVQLPEPTDPKSEAHKAGYKNICEIGKERIRRAGEKIIGGGTSVPHKNGTEVPAPDIGFKVFKLDSSNIKAWDPDSEDLEQSLFDAVNNIKSDRTEADLLYEILLKYGLDLTLPIEELTLAGKKVYVVGLGSLIICLDEQITLDVVEEIAKLKEKYGADDLMRVVFRDNGFKDAEVKTNAIQILKQFGIDDVKSL